MSILSVDNISPIGSGTSVTINNAATLVLTNANIAGVTTASGGVRVNADGSTSANYISVGVNDDLKIYHHSAGVSQIYNSTGYLELYANAATWIKTTQFNIIDNDATHYHIRTFKDGAVELYHDNVKKFETTSAGVSVTGNLDLPDNTSGNASIRLGNSQDFFMNHNGTHSYIINNTGNLYIRDLNGDVHIQGKDNEESIIAKADGAVELYHNNSKKLSTKSTGVGIAGVLEFEGGYGTYSTNSNSTWQTLFTFSNANNNGFSMECAVAENNYSTIYKVGGTAMWNSCYFTSDHAGDSNHAHSSDIEFRVLNDSGTKRLQFKAVSYTTTRYLTVISLWVKSGSVTWS